MTTSAPAIPGAHPSAVVGPLIRDAQMHVYRPTEPVEVTVVKNEICMLKKSASIVRDIHFDVSGTKLSGMCQPGQALGVLPDARALNNGIDPKTGKPHKLRLYSFSHPTRGHDGAGNVVSVTVKRTIDEHWDTNSLFLGGGKAISAATTAAGLQARFVQGQRYTDAATLTIVERVLVRTVNTELCALLQEEGASPYPLHSLGSCVLFGERAGTDAAPGKPSEDLGLVGRITRVAAPIIVGLAAQRLVPIIAPVALTSDGASKLNVNADLAAGAVAAALAAPIFMLVSDTPGIRTSADAAAPCALTLSQADVTRHSASGIIAGGMLPKLHACFEALRGGSTAVSIIDGRQPQTILSVALSEPGEAIAGTWVVA